MPKQPPVAKSELEVAQIIWRLGEASVRQVLEALPKERDLDFKTVQTYMRRLEAKGYLTATQRGRAKIYRPKVRPERVIRNVIDDLVQRVFGGDWLPLFQHLIDDRRLTPAEIAELRQCSIGWRTRNDDDICKLA